MPLFDRRQIRRAFGRAASTYEAAAGLQKEAGTRLLEQLDALRDQPTRILDLGAGTGLATLELRRSFRKAQVIAADLALPMLHQARRRAGWWRPLFCVGADAVEVPFIDASFDLVFSNLCLQWVEDSKRALAGLRRILRSEGLLLFSTFGPDTLCELREAFAMADDAPHVSRFASIQQWGDALLSAGFRDPVLYREHFTLNYPDAPALMRELKALGASNALASRLRGLTGKKRMQRMIDAYETRRQDAVLPSTWEVIYAQAFGPPPGQPQRDAEGEIAVFPVNQLKIRRSIQLR